VLLSGEAGIGKSRLIRALRDRLAAEPHTTLYYQYGLANPKVAALSFLGRGLQLSGYAERARRCSVGLARELGHANSLAFALIYGAAPHHHAAGDAPATAAALRAFRGLPEAQKLPMWRAYADVFDGWVLVREGRPSEGLELIEAGLKALAATASRFQHSQMLAVLAEAQDRCRRARGRRGDARRRLGFRGAV
jgi:hypothetical protein